MKKYLVAVFVMFIALPLYAGEKGGPKGMRGWEKRCENRIEKLAEELNLTAEQQESLKKIMEESRVQVESKMKAMKEEVKALKEAAERKIDSVLTDEQRKKYAELKNRMNDWMKGERQGKPRGDKRGEKWK